MKEYKWIKALIVMLFASVVGYFIGMGVVHLKNNQGIESIKGMYTQLTPTLFWISLAFGIVGLLGFIYFNQLLKQDNYSNEEDSLYERYKKLMEKVMVCSTISIIFNFTALGLNLSQELDIIYLLVFSCNVIFGSLGEVLNVSLMKKIRPELNADPLDKKFKKHYFDTLDECEKDSVGRASFKTVSLMIPAYIISLLLCYLLIALFNVSTVICLPIGVLWLVQTVTLVSYSSK